MLYFLSTADFGVAGQLTVSFYFLFSLFHASSFTCFALNKNPKPKMYMSVARKSDISFYSYFDTIPYQQKFFLTK